MSYMAPQATKSAPIISWAKSNGRRGDRRSALPLCSSKNLCTLLFHLLQQLLHGFVLAAVAIRFDDALKDTVALGQWLVFNCLYLVLLDEVAISEYGMTDELG